MALDQIALDAPTILHTIAAHGDKLYQLGARKLGLFGSFCAASKPPTATSTSS